MKESKFDLKFPDEEAAINYFIKIAYNGILTCPYCKATDKVYRYKKRPKACHCKNCNNSFSVFKNTIFEKSKTALRLWFYAIYLFLTSRKGFPAYHLQRFFALIFHKVTYKTAFRMFHQIRIAMQNRKLIPFEGTVEMDETYFGGKPRKRPPKLYDPAAYNESKKLITGRGILKTAVAGIKELKSGRIYTQVMPFDVHVHGKKKRLSGLQLKAVIDKTCTPGTTIITDEFPSYDILDKPLKVDLSLLDDDYTPPCYDHHTVCHKDYEWVAGKTKDSELIHTNGIESHWATVKRSHYGVYHSISPKYRQRYLDEYSFRQDTRKMSYQEVFDLFVLRGLIPSARFRVRALGRLKGIKHRM